MFNHTIFDLFQIKLYLASIDIICLKEVVNEDETDYWDVFGISNCGTSYVQ